MRRRYIFRAIGLASAIAVVGAGCATQDRHGNEGPGRKAPEKSSALRVEGMVSGLDGAVLSIAGIAGKTNVVISDETRIYKSKAASTADIATGKWLAADTARTGSSSPMKASSIRLSGDPTLVAEFPSSDSSGPKPSSGDREEPTGGPGGGDRGGPPSGPVGRPNGERSPEGGKDSGSSRLIGEVVNVEGNTVTVSTRGFGNKSNVAVIVDDDTEIVELTMAAATDIKTKARVVVAAEKDRNGKLEARSIEID